MLVFKDVPDEIKFEILAGVTKIQFRVKPTVWPANSTAEMKTWKFTWTN